MKPPATAAAWTPANLGSALALWFDADDAGTITLYGSNNVTQWADKSGQSRHLGEYGPTYDPSWSSNIQNGRYSVYFSGDKTLKTASLSSLDLTASGDHAFAFCLRQRTSGKQPQYGMLVENNQRLSGHCTWDDGNFYADMGALNARVYFTPDSWVGNSHIVLGTRTSDALSLRQNGTEKTTGTAGSSVGDFSTDWNIRTYNSLDHDFFEIVWVKGALSSANRDRLEGYLAWKWGLQGNLPSDHTYKNAAP